MGQTRAGLAQTGDVGDTDSFAPEAQMSRTNLGGAAERGCSRRSWVFGKLLLQGKMIQAEKDRALRPQLAASRDAFALLWPMMAARQALANTAALRQELAAANLHAMGERGDEAGAADKTDGPAHAESANKSGGANGAEAEGIGRAGGAGIKKAKVTTPGSCRVCGGKLKSATATIHSRCKQRQNKERTDGRKMTAGAEGEGQEKDATPQLQDVQRWKRLLGDFPTVPYRCATDGEGEYPDEQEGLASSSKVGKFTDKFVAASLSIIAADALYEQSDQDSLDGGADSSSSSSSEFDPPFSDPQDGGCGRPVAPAVPPLASPAKRVGWSFWTQPVPAAGHGGPRSVGDGGETQSARTANPGAVRMLEVVVNIGPTHPLAAPKRPDPTDTGCGRRVWAATEAFLQRQDANNWGGGGLPRGIEGECGGSLCLRCHAACRNCSGSRCCGAGLRRWRRRG